MRRLLTGLGLASAAAVVLARFRRRKPAPAEAEPPGQPGQPEQQEPPLDERRRSVHDRARAAMDDMLGGEDLPGEEAD
jgi:hypothetical protein